MHTNVLLFLTNGTNIHFINASFISPSKIPNFTFSAHLPNSFFCSWSTLLTIDNTTYFVQLRLYLLCSHPFRNLDNKLQEFHLKKYGLGVTNKVTNYNIIYNLTSTAAKAFDFRQRLVQTNFHNLIIYIYMKY